MFSETQDLFRFLLEMGKSCPKELFKIARCFRSYFVRFFESFQKVTERSRMLVTIQTRILNTFSKQGTKIMQVNIMCVSNSHMDMFGNVFFFFSVIFTEGEKEERLLPVFEAMDHRNLHYHTALQAVH